MTDESHRLQALHLPERKPAAWPCETWVSPRAWIAENGQGASSLFTLLENGLAVCLSEVIRSCGSICVGFHTEDRLPAVRRAADGRIYMLLPESAFRSDLLWLLHLYNLSKEKDPHRVRPDDRRCIWKEDTELRLYIAALLQFCFLITHECAHLRAGHFQLKRDEDVYALTRQMELCADHAAFWMLEISVSIYPMFLENEKDPLNKLMWWHHAQGYALGHMFLRLSNRDRASTPATYPSAAERLLLMMRCALTNCTFDESDHRSVLATSRKYFLIGMIDAVREASVILAVNPKAAKLGSGSSSLCLPCPPKGLSVLQRLSTLSSEDAAVVACVPCSDWAKELLEATEPLVQEIFGRADIFSKYASTGGFNVKDLHRDRLFDLPNGQCRMRVSPKIAHDKARVQSH